MEREEVEQMARRLAAKPASEATYLEHVAALALQASIAKDGGNIAPITHAHLAIQGASILIAMLAASKASPLDHYDHIARLMEPNAADNTPRDIE